MGKGMFSNLLERKPLDEVAPVLEQLTLEQRVNVAQQDYHAAVAKLARLEAEFQGTDFSVVPIQLFQAKESEIRQQQNIVVARQATAAQIETEWAQQREEEQRVFVQVQKQVRLNEIEAELKQISDEIPLKQLLLNRLPLEIGQLRQKSTILQEERARLL